MVAFFGFLLSAAITAIQAYLYATCGGGIVLAGFVFCATCTAFTGAVALHNITKP